MTERACSMSSVYPTGSNDPTRRLDGVVDECAGGQLTVRDDHPAVVSGRHDGVEDLYLPHAPAESLRLDVVADLVGLQQQDDDPAREVLQGVLQSEADREGGGSKDETEARGGDSEDAQSHDDDDDLQTDPEDALHEDADGLLDVADLEPATDQSDEDPDDDQSDDQDEDREDQPRDEDNRVGLEDLEQDRAGFLEIIHGLDILQCTESIGHGFGGHRGPGIHHAVVARGSRSKRIHHEQEPLQHGNSGWKETRVGIDVDASRTDDHRKYREHHSRAAEGPEVMTPGPCS